LDTSVDFFLKFWHAQEKQKTRHFKEVFFFFLRKKKRYKNRSHN
jgi:hypothetical protein